MDFVTGLTENYDNTTELPIKNLDYAVGRILFENVTFLNSTNSVIIRATGKPLTETEVDMLKKACERNPENFPKSIRLVSIIPTLKQQSLSVKDKKETIDNFSNSKRNFKSSIYKNTVEKEIDNISKNAEVFINNIKFASIDGGISYNYLDYGMANPYSYDRTVNALAFIVSLGKAYNVENPNGKNIDLKSLAQAGLLSTIGDLYSPSNMSTNAKMGSIDSKVELGRFYSKTVDSPNFIKRCPKFTFSILENYDSKYISIYSYLMLKGKENYSTVDSITIDAILKSNENLDGSGPLGIPLITTGDDARKSDVMAQMIKIGFLWQDKLIELRENSYLENPATNQISNVVDFYQTLRQIANYNEIDKNLLELMIRINPLYQTNDTVVLSNGLIATVLRQNNDYPEQPLVGYKKDNGDIEAVDLRKTLNMTIKHGYATYELEHLIQMKNNENTMSDSKTK